MYLYKTQDTVHSEEAAQHTEKERKKTVSIETEKVMWVTFTELNFLPPVKCTCTTHLFHWNDPVCA